MRSSVPIFAAVAAKLLGVIDGKHPSASYFRNIRQQFRPVYLFRSLRIKGKNPEGINLNIGFPHQRLDFSLRVMAMIVAPVGDDQQSLSLILGLPHLGDAQINRIQQRGAALWRAKTSLLSMSSTDLRKVGKDFGRVAEGDQEELILGI